jgi:hypothetical protein
VFIPRNSSPLFNLFALGKLFWGRRGQARVGRTWARQRRS